MGTHKAVRSLERGLAVLAALNEQNGSPVSEISAIVGLHRTTVYRLLETLCEAGYVRHTDSDNSYRLTLKTRSLGDGFNDEAWVSDVAAPVLAWLVQQISWPSDLATFSNGGMTVRETTHRFSPFSVHRAMVGKTLPMLTTSMGRAYLAHCPEEEREIIVNHLIKIDSPGANLVKQSGTLERIIDEVRHNGYASSAGEHESKMNAIAVPIMFGTRVFACMNVVMFRSSLQLDEAIERYLPALQKAARRIEHGLAQQSDAAAAPVSI